MTSFTLASSNQHKASEFAELFKESAIKVVPTKDSLDVIEDGNTYEENAFKKARAYFDLYQQPVISDDSGLNVEALPNDLGILSARFGGEGLSDKERAYLLLEKLADKPDVKERTAYFSCTLCFYLGSQEVFFFEGRIQGHIGRDYKGEHGFGYDPVFIPQKHDGVSTLAMIPEWKAENSHRARACQLALKFFQERVGQN
jgi:XTP/dITP diphosphohydrolase